MNLYSELIGYEIRHRTPEPPDRAARAVLAAEQRRSRRHRLAGRMRALADRVDS